MFLLFLIILICFYTRGVISGFFFFIVGANIFAGHLKALPDHDHERAGSRRHTPSAKFKKNEIYLNNLLKIKSQISVSTKISRTLPTSFFILGVCTLNVFNIYLLFGFQKCLLCS